jgi:hypothetical protein
MKPLVSSPRPARLGRMLALAFVLGAVAGPASAQLPAVQTQGEIRYLSGGIGSDESEAIKAARDSYPLTLTLAGKADGRDVYLSSVPVTIRDASGKTVLEVTTSGPYLLADLPAGRYEISARYAGEEKKTSASITAGKPQRLSLLWPKANAQPQAGAAASVASPAVGISAGAGLSTTSSATTVATAVLPAAASAASSALPQINTQGGIPYLSGGIGSDESAAIKAAASRYSLAVTLAGTQDGRNVYLSSVPITVKDASGGVVLDVVSDGPYLLADLPPGNYRVSARFQDEEKSADARVAAGKSARVSFLWKGKP